jgi:hypothetical protein
MRATTYRLLAVSFTAYFWAATSARAQLGSFTQSPLASGGSYLSELTDEQSGDNFSFASRSRVLSVVWWGVYLTPSPEADDFTVRFFQPALGNPKLTADFSFTDGAVTRTNSGLFDSFGDPIYRYQVQLPTTSAVVFPAGATRYLSVVNDTVDGWFWQVNSASGSNWFRFDELDPWQASAGGNLAFEVHGVTLLPGDFDADYDVDGQDFLVWQRTVGSTSELAADSSGDGVVNAADLALWRTSFGSSAPPAAASATAIPEPSGLALLAVGWATAVASRRLLRGFPSTDAACR